MASLAAEQPGELMLILGSAPPLPAPAPPAVLLRLALWALAVLLLPTQQVYGGPGGGSYLWLRLFGVDRCPAALASLAAFFLSVVYLMLALRWMTSEHGGAAWHSRTTALRCLCRWLETPEGLRCLLLLLRGSSWVVVALPASLRFSQPCSGAACQMLAVRLRCRHRAGPVLCTEPQAETAPAGHLLLAQAVARILFE
jgi:hypothetical protein